MSVSEDTETMGQNISKRRELVKLLDQVASDARLEESLKLILDVKDAESFSDRPFFGSIKRTVNGKGIIFGQNGAALRKRYVTAF